MIDVTDTKTADLIGDLRKRRGRPPTGTARTAAQRKAEQRARARETFVEGGGVFSAITTPMLCEMLSSYIGQSQGYLSGSIMKELAKRASKSNSEVRIAVIVTEKK
jgi:hypothetical protein